MSRIITLTTDFGLKDPYQGAMKGAILSVNPGARIVDITHLVAPGNILEGALMLDGAWRFFPPGTVHVCVVDPGVGTARKPILIETGGSVFVGPDNGIFSLALKGGRIKRAVELKDRRYFLREVSATFHGRDIFAPVAAHLTLGVAPSSFGPELKRIASLKLPPITRRGGCIYARIIHVDAYGNLITNIRMEDIGSLTGCAVTLNNVTMRGIKKTYADVKKGEPAALVGSTCFLEIAVNAGRASDVLRSGAGDRVVVKTQERAFGPRRRVEA